MGPREIARSKDVTAHSTEKSQKSAKAGPRPWEIEQYIYQEEPRDDQRSSHDDPRLEFALQSLSLHQDDFIPFDDDSDHGYGYPACGLGAMPDLHASASSVTELGTLAGDGGPNESTTQQEQPAQRLQRARRRTRQMQSQLTQEQARTQQMLRRNRQMKQERERIRQQKRRIMTWENW